jgi:hypothetical protein
MKFLIFLFYISFTFPAMALCTNEGSIQASIYNKTGIPLVASTYMHWQVFSVNDNSSNLDFDNKFDSKSVGGVHYGKYSETGSVYIDSCAGGGTYYSRAYDLGVSVGPYNFIFHQGSWPNWQTGLDNNFSGYLLDTTKWSGRDIDWSIYVPDKRNYTVKQLTWSERSKCSTEYRDYSICWAVELKNCNAGGSCDTWEDYYINNVGSGNGNYRSPLGKF